METMRAIEMHGYGGPDVLTLEEVPLPEIGLNEVLIKVRDAGVNPIDWKIRAGYYRAKLPLIPGSDVAGDIAKVGPQVTLFREGDAVYGHLDTFRDGTYAEYVATRADYLALKPKALDYVQAAALPLTALVAWQALFEVADLKPGQAVFIHGAAGGIGHIAVQLAKWKGAQVLATAAGKDVDFVKHLGADEVVDYTRQRFEEAARDIDVVLDVIGGETQDRSWQTLKPNGILISTVGIAHPDAPDRYGVRGITFVAHPDGSQLAKIAELIDAGKLKPTVSSVFPLAEARRAQQLSQNGQVRGKIVLKVAD